MSLKWARHTSCSSPTPAYERDMQACLHELRGLDVVRRIGGLVRVVGP